MMFYDYPAYFYDGSADEINLYYKTERVCKDLVLLELKESRKILWILRLRRLFTGQKQTGVHEMSNKPCSKQVIAAKADFEAKAN